MTSTELKQTFREENRKIHDSIIEVIHAFEHGDDTSVRSILNKVAFLTGTYSDHEEETETRQIAQDLRVTNPKTVDGLVRMLSDEYSRKLLVSSISKAKSVEELSKENGIPLSTCYRRVRELVDSNIMIVERIIITSDGKKYELMRSAYKGVKIDFEDGNIVIDAIVNEDVSDKLYNLWISMRA